MKRVPARRDSTSQPADTIPFHAHPPLAQAAVDGLGIGLGAGLLAGVRSAEFSFLLRSRQPAHRRRPLARESAHFFLAGYRPALLSDALYHRFGGRSGQRTSLDWRYGIHVRSARSSVDSPAQSVSCGGATAAAVGDLAFRL